MANIVLYVCLHRPAMKESEIEERFKENERQLVEQDQRLFASLWTLVKLLFKDKKEKEQVDVGLKRAAWISFLHNAFFGRNSAVVITSFSLVSVLGVYLAWQANNFIRAQNELLTKQNFLIESERRSALVFELSSILNEIDEELDEHNDKLHEAGLHMEKMEGAIAAPYMDNGQFDFTQFSRDIHTLNDSLRHFGLYLSQLEEQELYQLQPELSALLQARIIAVLSAMRPYRYLNFNGELIEEARSPERGQLLLSLLESNTYCNKVMQRGDFHYVDFRNVQILPLAKHWFDLANIQMDHSDLIDSEVSGVDFGQAHMRSVNLSGTRFSNCQFNVADISSSELTGTNFWHCDMTAVDFRSASFNNSRFTFCNLKHADIEGQVTNRILFDHCFLPDTIYLDSVGDCQVVVNDCLTANPDFVLDNRSSLGGNAEFMKMEILTESQRNDFDGLGHVDFGDTLYVIRMDSVPCPTP